MKNFDLDNLEKKMPYSMPNNFFAEMQQNVLDKTVNTPSKKEETKIIPFNFKWVAAASVILMAGITAFFTTQESQKDLILSQKSEIIDSAYNPSNSNIATLETTSLKENNLKVEKKNITKPIKITTTKNKEQSIQISKKDTPTPKANPELRLNQSLAAFTSSEITEIERSTEQDVYLDLYN